MTSIVPWDETENGDYGAGGGGRGGGWRRWGGGGGGGGVERIVDEGREGVCVCVN